MSMCLACTATVTAADNLADNDVAAVVPHLSMNYECSFGTFTRPATSSTTASSGVSLCFEGKEYNIASKRRCCTVCRQSGAAPPSGQSRHSRRSMSKTAAWTQMMQKGLGACEHHPRALQAKHVPCYSHSLLAHAVSLSPSVSLVARAPTIFGRCLHQDRRQNGRVFRRVLLLRQQLFYPSFNIGRLTHPCARAPGSPTVSRSMEHLHLRDYTPREHGASAPA